MPEGYAVEGFSYHKGAHKIIMYCGHDDPSRPGRHGVRHFAGHTQEYEFAVAKTSEADLRRIGSAEDWQEMTTAGVLVNPYKETSKGPDGNCSSRQLNLVLLDVRTGSTTLVDSSVYRVGWHNAGLGFPERAATAFVSKDKTHCDGTPGRAAAPRAEFPIEPGTVTCGLEGGGCFMHEGPVSIYKSNRTIAAELRGLIRDRYSAMGWENGPNKYPTSNEFCELRDGGCGQRYEDGLIYWSPSSGAWSVHGAIVDKYASIGWENSQLGYPIGNEFCGLIRGGCGQHFQRADGSIYWSPGTGAHSVQGLIRKAWADLGWERSWLGYPISDEEQQGAGRASSFEGGFLYWHPDTGVYGEGWPTLQARSTGDGATRRFGTPPPEDILVKLRSRHP